MSCIDRHVSLHARCKDPFQHALLSHSTDFPWTGSWKIGMFHHTVDQVSWNFLTVNRPFLHYLRPLFWSKSWCSSFHKQNNFHSHGNEFNLCVNENWFAYERMSTKKKRPEVIQKWSFWSMHDNVKKFPGPLISMHADSSKSSSSIS